MCISSRLILNLYFKKTLKTVLQYRKKPIKQKIGNSQFGAIRDVIVVNFAHLC